MAEIALVSARKSRLRHDAEKGDKRAAEALLLAEKPDIFLSTVQIGITVIGILTGLISGDRLSGPLTELLSNIEFIRPFAPTVAITIIVICITYLSLVFGELVPKRLGLTNPERISKFMAAPMNLLSRIGYPFVALLTVSNNLIIRLLNIKKTTDSIVTEEEIKAIVHEGKQAGTIDEIEQEIVERVFHLGDRNIESLMTHRTDIIWLDISNTIDEIRVRIRENLHSTYPVCNGSIDDVLGVVYIKDMFAAESVDDLKNFIRVAQFIPDNNTAYEVLEKFKLTKVHYGFIVDEFGVMQGMVTLKDILEALIGEMPESNDDVYEIINREDGTYLVDGQIPFYQFFGYFGIKDFSSYFDEDFNTLAGFILDHFGHIPNSGEKFEWRLFTFEIVDMDRNRIDKVLVSVHNEMNQEA